MKKLVSLLVGMTLAVALATMCFAQPAYTVVSQTTQQLADGSSVTITVSKAENALTRASTVSGKKDYTYSNGGTAWVFTVHGSFSVNNGVSATCTSATYGFVAHQTGWKVASGSAKRSGNTASASATVTGVRTVYPSVSLSCDANGNLY